MAEIIHSDRFELTAEERKAIAVEASHFEQPRAAVIEALKIVQKRQGWVPDGAIHAIARELGIGAAEVEGVATFYNLIFRQPVGRHVIKVCDSISCFLTGYEPLRDALSQHLRIGLGQTTADGRFTLLPNCCLGNCDKGPALMLDDDTHGPLQPGQIEQLLEGYP
jgi:NADH-quinone oxidoreductase subunit E